MLKTDGGEWVVDDEWHVRGRSSDTGRIHFVLAFVRDAGDHENASIRLDDGYTLCRLVDLRTLRKMSF